MFGLLKNKISSFISNLTQKKTEEEAEPKEEKPAQAEKPPEPQKQPLSEKPLLQEKVQFAPQKKQILEIKPVQEKKEAEKTTAPALPKTKPQTPEKQPEKKTAELLSEHKQEKQETKKQPEQFQQAGKNVQQQTPSPVSIFNKVNSLLGKPAEIISGVGKQEQKKSLEANLSLESKVRSVFSSDVEIREKDVSSLLENLEFSLLESDVAFEVSQALVEDLRSRLVGRKVRKDKLGEEIKNSVKESLVSVLNVRKPDFWRILSEHPKPVKILFVGPNGAGKTTTMSKLASVILSKNYSCLFSASDTFRAAAIEQTVHHAEKLGVGVVKHKYGADPAAVAFDAVSHAKSHNINVVLIDSAGRQDTNANLIDELKKINRVVKPDLKLFVGESIAGNAIIDQVNAFHAAIGLDAVILTKLDCDAKGGTALSISKSTGVPILFIGVGQGYGDLIEFDARSIAEQILT
ncbi:signal recognition particle-docking protein FtsY [Candidatus Micrarchaeota archaeon]|nr:signal recognition particle-docking protein FtsY [Candidatus Micrarchaeota archaeon]